MDKYQEALMNLDLFCSNHVKGRTNGFRFPRDLAILQELVDKEKSRKPITHTQEGVYAIPLCPKCKKPLNEHKDKPNYCSNCGRKLDWSDEK